MTNLERLRLQDATRAVLGTSVGFDPERLSPTRLATYVLSLPGTERQARRAELVAALEVSLARAVRRTNARFGRVACVLDRSWSSSGSSEKRRRPLATSCFVRAAAAEHRAFWTYPTTDESLVDAVGQTDLVTPLLDAMAWEARSRDHRLRRLRQRSAGHAGEVLAIARANGLCPFTLHVNPVFDDVSLGPKPIGGAVPTMGIRDAEDLPTAIAFGEFANDGRRAHRSARARALRRGDVECHLGERMLREDGTPEYLKTYRLSAAQVRRAYLLQQLAAAEWNLERAAESLRGTVPELTRRLVNAGFGYLLKPAVLQALPQAGRR